MLLRAATISPANDRKAFSRDYPQKIRTHRVAPASASPFSAVLLHSRADTEAAVLPLRAPGCRVEHLSRASKIFTPFKDEVEERLIEKACAAESFTVCTLTKAHYNRLSERCAQLLRADLTRAEIAHQMVPGRNKDGSRPPPASEKSVYRLCVRLVRAKLAKHVVFPGRGGRQGELGLRLLTVEARCMQGAEPMTFAQRKQAVQDKLNAQSAAKRAARRARWAASQEARKAEFGHGCLNSDFQNAPESQSEPSYPQIHNCDKVHRRKRDRLGRFAPPLSQAVLAEAEALAQPGCAAQPREADRFLKPQPLAQPDGPHPRQNEDPRPGPSPAVPQPPKPGVEALKICPLRGVGAFGGAEPASLSADEPPAASDLPCSPADMAPGMPPEMPEPEAPAATPDATEAFMQAAMRSVGYSLHHGFSAAERRSAEAWLARSPAHGERPDAWAKIWQRERHEGRAARPVTGMAAELAQHIKRAAAATPEDEPATPATEFFDPKAPWLQPLRATDAAGACQQILDIQRRLRDPALRGDEPGTRNARRAAAQRLRDLEMVCLGLKQRPMALTDFETFRQQHPWAHSLVVGTDGRDALRFNLGPDLWTHLAARIDLETSVEYRMDHPDTAPLRDPARVFFRRLQKWAYAQPAYRRLAYR